MDTVNSHVIHYPIDTMTKGHIHKLELSDLTLELGRRLILDGISLDVHHGETVCVLGGSGAGKSMLLRTIVRLHEPTRGDILLDGRSVLGMDPSDLRRRVGLVQQSPAMLEGTVEDNLRFGLDLAGVAPDEVQARVLASLEAAALDGSFLDRRAEKLSGGERQRVALARAHALRPEVLLLDEPTAALDPRRTREVERAVCGLKGDTDFMILIVTHDVEQARRLGDRTLLMRQGRIVAEGDSDTLLEDMDPEERAMYMGELEHWEYEHEVGDADE
jgi:ABC-type methionine transport system ATPase subunit